MKKNISDLENIERLVHRAYNGKGKILRECLNEEYKFGGDLGYSYKTENEDNGTVTYNVYVSKLPDKYNYTQYRTKLHEYGHIYLTHFEGNYEELDQKICNVFRDYRGQIIDRINKKCDINFGDKLIERVIDDPVLNHALHNIAMDMEVNTKVLSDEDVKEMEKDLTELEISLLPEGLDKESKEYKAIINNIKVKLILPCRYHTSDGKPFSNNLSYVEYLIMIIENLDQFVKMMISIIKGGDGDTSTVSDGDLKQAMGNGMSSLNSMMVDSGLYDESNDSEGNPGSGSGGGGSKSSSGSSSKSSQKQGDKPNDGSGSGEGEGKEGNCGEDTEHCTSKGKGVEAKDFERKFNGSGSGSGSDDKDSKSKGSGSGKDSKDSNGKDSDGKGSDGKGSDGKESNEKDSDGKGSDGNGSDGSESDGSESDGSEHCKNKSNNNKDSKGKSGDGSESNSDSSGKAVGKGNKSKYKGIRSNSGLRLDHFTPSREVADKKRDVGEIVAGGGLGCGSDGRADEIRTVIKRDPVDEAIDEAVQDQKKRVIKINMKRDLLKNYNLGRNRTVIIPSISQNITYDMDPRIVYLIDISGSMDTELIDRILSSIGKKMRMINKGLKYDIISWSTELGEHIKNIDPARGIPKISTGGGTSLARGIAYFKNNYDSNSILIICSDFEDYLDEWCKIVKTMPDYSIWGFDYGCDSDSKDKPWPKNFKLRNFVNGRRNR